jgi:hypothetical protein
VQKSQQLAAESMPQSTPHSTRFADRSSKSKLHAKPSPSTSTSSGPFARVSRIVSNSRRGSRSREDRRGGDTTILMARPSEHIWVRNDKDVWQLVRKVATTGDAVDVEVKGEKLRVSFKNTLPFEPEQLETWNDVFQVRLAAD